MTLFNGLVQQYTMKILPQKIKLIAMNGRYPRRAKVVADNEINERVS